MIRSLSWRISTATSNAASLHARPPCRRCARSPLPSSPRPWPWWPSSCRSRFKPVSPAGCLSSSPSRSRFPWSSRRSSPYPSRPWPAHGCCDPSIRRAGCSASRRCSKSRRGRSEAHHAEPTRWIDWGGLRGWAVRLARRDDNPAVPRPRVLRVAAHGRRLLAKACRGQPLGIDAEIQQVATRGLCPLHPQREVVLG